MSNNETSEQDRALPLAALRACIERSRSAFHPQPVKANCECSDCHRIALARTELDAITAALARGDRLQQGLDELMRHQSTLLMLQEDADADRDERRGQAWEDSVLVYQAAKVLSATHPTLTERLRALAERLGRDARAALDQARGEEGGGACLIAPDSR